MRLITYNIHKGIGGRDRKYDLARVIEVIRHEKPDIVCLQEVDRNVRRSGFDDQPRILASQLSAKASTFQFNHSVRGPKAHPGSSGYGNLVLSRWSIDQKHNVGLRMNSRKNRRAQIAVIRTPAGPLRLVNWHLGLGEKERHWQVRKLLGNQHYERYCDHPTLIVGDSNDWRNTLHAGAFSDHGLSQVTHPPSRFRSFPAYMPVGALDKAFVCDRIKVERAHVVRSKLAKKASDHLPLVIDFKIA